LVSVYAIEDGSLRPIGADPRSGLPEGAVWIDVVAPTDDERAAVERALGLTLPALEAVSGIQPSSRLVARDGALFATAMVPSGDRAQGPVVPVTFVQAGQRLVTLADGAEDALRDFPASRTEVEDASGLLAALLAMLVDRIADLLEAVGEKLDHLGRASFRQAGAAVRHAHRRTSIRKRTARLEDVILGVGAERELAARLRECLHSLLRLATFAAEHTDGAEKDRLEGIAVDLRTVAEYDSNLTGDMEFMLDATVGLIDIQQNKVIYLLSIVSVVLTPPVLVASIYGMNFKDMPELGWPWGYAWGLGLMLVSAVGPFLFFMARGWL
jgi:magnesium transporter